MTSRIGTIDIDQMWDRFVHLMVKAGRTDADEFELFDGDPEPDVRVPWVVRDKDGRVVLTLGYTKRDAFTALTIATSTLAITFGA